MRCGAGARRCARCWLGSSCAALGAGAAGDRVALGARLGLARVGRAAGDSCWVLGASLCWLGWCPAGRWGSRAGCPGSLSRACAAVDRVLSVLVPRLIVVALGAGPGSAGCPPRLGTGRCNAALGARPGRPAGRALRLSASGSKPGLCPLRPGAGWLWWHSVLGTRCWGAGWSVNCGSQLGLRAWLVPVLGPVSVLVVARAGCGAAPGSRAGAGRPPTASPASVVLPGQDSEWHRLLMTLSSEVIFDGPTLSLSFVIYLPIS